MVAQYEYKWKKEEGIIVSGDSHITEKQKSAIELKKMFCIASLIDLDICFLFYLFIYSFNYLFVFIACLIILFMYLFIHLFMYLFVCFLSIYLFITLSLLTVQWQKC
jgi:hypothetical protein